MTQFIPQLRIGYLYTYWAPLVSQGAEIEIWGQNRGPDFKLKRVFVSGFRVFRNNFEGIL